MRTGSVKKYVIPNIPYLFVLWACLKLGTAYRLAAGADFPHKLMGLGQTVGPAFADLAPGLDPFDWLVGIVGAVGFRLLIYFKSKNAKKFRRDEEFGSARWGGPKDRDGRVCLATQSPMLPKSHAVNVAVTWEESCCFYPGRSCGGGVGKKSESRSNNELQEVSRGHSTLIFSKGRAEQS